VTLRASGVLLLDGGVGTALRAAGLPDEAFPEEWVVRRPSAVARVHASHVAAGARLVLTCTFNAARLERCGLDGATEDVCHRAVLLARQARPPLVAGCVGPTGLVGPGGGGPDDGELRERHERPLRALAAAGADLLWIETHVALREARAALAAARATGRACAASLFLAEAPGGLAALDGTPGEECLAALWREGAAAVGVNCVAPGPGLAALVARAVVRVGVPLLVKPNAGLPEALLGPEGFAAATWPALRAGARLAGGCCGAGPAHLRALGAAARRR
jgi:5-methyltetrahydrofolate--homocysteine methyltransferase